VLNQPTLEKLHALRLHGMAEAFRAQSEQTGIAELSFEERFALLVDQQWTWRQNRALERRLAKAKLRHRASVEDIDFRAPRGLDRTLLRSPKAQLGCVSIRTFSHRPDRDREELSGLCSGREGLPRWVHRLLHPGQPTVSRPGSGTRRRKSAQPARPHGPP